MRDREREQDTFVNLSWVRVLSTNALLTVAPFFHSNRHTLTRTRTISRSPPRTIAARITRADKPRWGSSRAGTTRASGSMVSGSTTTRCSD